MDENFDLWIKSLAREGTYPYLLEYKNGYKLFKIERKHIIKHNYYNAVTFHIWKNDNWLYTGIDYQVAYKHWRNYVDE